MIGRFSIAKLKEGIMWKALKRFWCERTHGGGTTCRDEQGRINLRLPSGRRWADNPLPLEAEQRFNEWLNKRENMGVSITPSMKQEPVVVGDDWTPCVKLPVVVHVRKQRPGETHVSTREGITPLCPDDLIMRGVAGEEYPIGRELFERTYTAPGAMEDFKHGAMARTEGESEMNKVDEAWQVFQNLMRQYPLWPSTFSTCECGRNMARGNGKCWQCYT